MNELLLKHLVLGWQGFVTLMALATKEGVKMDPQTLGILDEQTDKLKTVINEQRKT